MRHTPFLAALFAVGLVPVQALAQSDADAGYLSSPYGLSDIDASTASVIIGGYVTTPDASISVWATDQTSDT